MRVYKFRAWDLENEQIHENIEETENDPDFILYDSRGNMVDVQPETFHFYLISEQFKVMQYTGLKDKNGREIYEGDIVFVNHHPFDYNGNYEVGYNDVMELCAGSLILHKVKNYCEVIGNIYENPELLEYGDD